MKLNRNEVFGVIVGFLVLLAIVFVIVDGERNSSNPCEGYTGRNDMRCMGYYSMPSAQRR